MEREPIPGVSHEEAKTPTPTPMEQHVVESAEHQEVVEKLDQEPAKYADIEDEIRTQYDQLIESKLAGARVEGLTPEQGAMLTNLLQEMVVKLHHRQGPEVTSQLIYGMFDRISVKPNDRVAQNGYKFVGGMHGKTLELYPRFFDADEKSFDRMHVLAHECGERVYAFLKAKHPEVLGQYRHYKLRGQYAVDGDYVNTFDNAEDQEREEFAETFGNLLESTHGSGLELTKLRFARTSNPEQYEQLQTTLEGQTQMLKLVEESTFFAALLNGTIRDIAPELAQSMQQSVDDEAAEEELEQMLEERMAAMMSPNYGAQQQAAAPKTKASENIVKWMLGL